VPDFLRTPSLPGMPGAAWLGVTVAGIGLILRAWALLTLRERYTRTLMTYAEHSLERGGPYRWIRHPGYLGSLLCLNGIAMASGSIVVLLASMAATLLAYHYRIRVEDQMLVRTFGEAYAAYRREVNALVPSKR
jgi:protein-S-isoprenylcysteine O-methyltransferase